MAYTILNDVTDNTTLTAGTYLLNYDVNWNGKTLTFDCAGGPIIIKRAGDYCFNYLSTVNTINSSATNKVYWTDKNDDTIGETIAGSTGTPVKSGLQLQNIATVADGYYLGAACTITNHEFRYALDSKFITHNGNTNTIFWGLTWKNCDYNISTSITAANRYVIDLQYQRASQGTNYHDFVFDNTNTLTGTSGLLKASTRDAIYNIYVQAANTAVATGIIYENIFTNTTEYNGANFSYIKIINAGTGYGFYYPTGRGNSNFSHNPDFLHCNCSIFAVNASYGIIRNCLFNSGLGGNGNGFYYYIGTNVEVKFKIENSVFTNLTYGINFYQQRNTVLTVLNNIFDSCSNTAIYCLNFSTAPIFNLNNNAYYNNVADTGGNPTVNETGKFTANPSFGNITAGTIDSTFDDYIPNGYKPSTADYQNKGSDTWDNLSIDETLYSPDGLRHKGTAKIWPGIYYLMTTFGGQADVTVTCTLPLPTLAATGNVVQIAGTVALTLPMPVVYALSVNEFGTAALTLPLPVLAATGNKVEIGTSALTLPIVTLAASGIQIITGTSALTLPIPVLAASGIQTIIGSSVLTLPVPVIVAAGYTTHFASSVLTLPTPALVATGIQIITGTAVLTLPIVTLTSSGVFYNEGTSILQLPICSLAASGIFYNSGTAALVLTVPVLAVSGFVAHQASSALVLPKLTVAVSGIVAHIATSALVLPHLHVNATGIQRITGTSTLTLPVILLSATGIQIISGTSILTLKVPVLACTAFKYDEIGTAQITLVKPVVAASGKLGKKGTVHLTLLAPLLASSGHRIKPVIGNLLLPILTVSSSGYLTHFATSTITLTKPQVLTIGHLIRFVTVTCTLPVAELNANGHLIRIVQPIALFLPWHLTVAASGFQINAGVELLAYNAFEKLFMEDVELNYCVTTWVKDRKARIFRQGDYPIVCIYNKGIVDEQYIGSPQYKVTTLEIELHGKVWNSDPDLLEIKKIKLGENMKDAVERDLQMAGTASMTKISDCRYRQLSRYVMECIITIQITTKAFYANNGRI